MRQSTDVLTGIRAKLKRAWQQWDALKANITAFLDRRPYEPLAAYNHKTHRLLVQVQVHGSPDPTWSVLIGEIVHDFKSALDHMAWQLAGRPSSRGAKTQFPIFETEAGFVGRGTRECLKGACATAIALIKSEQPFFVREDGTAEGTAKSPLWHLKELSDVDKHRVFRLTGSTLAVYTLELPRVTPFATPVEVYRHQGGPIKQDTILWTGTLLGATLVNRPLAQVDLHAGLRVHVAFEEGTPAPGIWDALGTLAEIGNRTDQIARRISEDIWKTEL